MSNYNVRFGEEFEDDWYDVYGQGYDLDFNSPILISPFLPIY